MAPTGRDRISTELRAIGESPEKASTNWMLRFRRNDNERSLAEHEEVLRYLAFLERQILPRRIYRLSGHELFSMNLMPR